MATNHYRALVSFAGDGLADRGVGPMVGASSTSVTNCVYAVGRRSGGDPHNTSLYTKVGGTHTERANATTTWKRWDIMALDVAETSPGSGVYVYTVLKALSTGGFSTVCSWTDSGGVITPGGYAGFAFEHRRAFFGNYSSPGIYATQLTDLIGV